jgi:hypothetical protein
MHSVNATLFVCSSRHSCENFPQIGNAQTTEDACVRDERARVRPTAMSIEIRTFRRHDDDPGFEERNELAMMHA